MKQSPQHTVSNDAHARQRSHALDDDGDKDALAVAHPRFLERLDFVVPFIENLFTHLFEGMADLGLKVR